MRVLRGAGASVSGRGVSIPLWGVSVLLFGLLFLVFVWVLEPRCAVVDDLGLAVVSAASGIALVIFVERDDVVEVVGREVEEVSRALDDLVGLHRGELGEGFPRVRLGPVHFRMTAARVVLRQQVHPARVVRVHQDVPPPPVKSEERRKIKIKSTELKLKKS